jgi:hypothetical protein
MNIHCTNVEKSGTAKSLIVATQGTQDKKTTKKHNTICVGHRYAQTDTNNVR